MSLSPEIPSAPQIKPLHLSLGATSPLWMVFAGAAATGAAYWWIKQWSRPVNLEAIMGAKAADADAEPEFERAPEPETASAVVAYEPSPVVEALGAAAPQPVEEPTPAMVMTEEAATSIIAEPDADQFTETVGAAAPQPVEEPTSAIVTDPPMKKAKAPRAPLTPPDA